MLELQKEDIENISTAFLSAKVLEQNATIPRPEKEILREVISTYTSNSKPENHISLPKKEKEHFSEEGKKVVASLSEKALTFGVRQAVSEAEKIGRPEIVEALHDWLVDHMYEKLLATGRIDPS